MQSPDGKQRLTDAADTETMLRIIQGIPSPKAEQFKQWLERPPRSPSPRTTMGAAASRSP